MGQDAAPRCARRHAAEGPIDCAVLTVSDTRRGPDDQSGPRAARMLEEAGHRVAATARVPDDRPGIRTALEAWLADPGVQLILTTGGTGLGRRDVTVEVVRDLLTLELAGFGELFRILSFEDVGAAAMLSRAAGGLVARAPGQGGDTFLFALPGSLGAVELAISRLILPACGHLVGLRGDAS